jgi:C-terminal processing protease CtpA/Prc
MNDARNNLLPLLLIAGLVLAPTGASAAEPSAAERAQLEKERAKAREELRDATQRLREVERKLQTERRVDRIERIRIGDRAMLGVTIDEEYDTRDADGVRLAGVSPGGPAADAGLQAGDVLQSIDGKSLKADREESAFEKLRSVLRERKPGDVVKLKAKRGSKTEEFSVTTEALGARGFAFGFGEGFPDNLGALAELWTPAPSPGAAPFPMPFVHRFSRVWGDLEMVSLSERLGAYFGTKQGVLVVRAPEAAGLALQDGDVILKVGGRDAQSPEQVMRVLRSYGPGEKLSLEVMRDRKKLTVEGSVPDDRVGWMLLPEPTEAPAVLGVPE